MSNNRPKRFTYLLTYNEWLIMTSPNLSTVHLTPENYRDSLRALCKTGGKICRIIKYQ